jgi:diguanylate cyclase (GGDEF)-like protein/PAS domain S-box-containing protein
MPQLQQNESLSFHHARASHAVATYRRRTVKLLVAHNQLRDVDLWLQELKRVQFAVSAEVVQTPETFVQRLRDEQFDVVLASGGIPNWTALQVLELLRLQDEEIPFIFLGTEVERDSMEEFIAKGASDCVYQNRLGRLPVAVAIAVEQRSIREERHRAQIELRQSEAHYHALTENPNYGIFRFDVNGQFLTVNKALAAMLGYDSTEALIGKNLATDIIRDPAERAQLFDSYRTSGHVAPMEMEWKRKDGTPMRVRLSGQRVDSQHEAPEESCEIIAEDVTAQRASEDNLRHLAATDALTGLANYRKLAETLESEMKRSDRTGRSFAVLAFDLDGMKMVNDTFGHLTGNRALQRLANTLRFSCRSIDTPARYGGDEFAIILPEAGARQAGLVGRRICERLADDHEDPNLTVSVGVGIYPEDGPTVDFLLRRADRDLYEMKNLKKIA